MKAKFDVTGAGIALLLCIAAALAALFLVPSSPALLVDDPVVLLEIDTGFVNEWEEPEMLTVTGYSVAIAVGAALAVALTVLIARLKGRSMAQGAATAALAGLLALLGGHWLFCAVRWSYIINDLGGSVFFPLQLFKGGYTMYGAILGGLLGGVIAARLTKNGVAETLDLLMPGALTLLAAGRIGEMWTGQGVANERASEALSFLPITKPDYWGDPRLATNVLAAVVAVAALVVAIVLLARSKPAGRAAECALGVISAFQLLLDSLRGDELIRFGFVCLNMIAAAAVLTFILVTRIVRRMRRGGWRDWETARILLFAVGVAIVIATEFALDGKIKLPGVSNTMLYVIDTMAVTGVMLSVNIADGREEVVG